MSTLKVQINFSYISTLRFRKLLLDSKQLIRISFISRNLLATLILSCDDLSMHNFVKRGKLLYIVLHVAEEDIIVSSGLPKVGERKLMQWYMRYIIILISYHKTYTLILNTSN